jgi:hypothetical protein
MHGEVRLEADQLARLDLDTPDGGLHRAIFRNGSVLSGLLVAESLKLDLDLGPVLETRRQVVSQVLLPAEDIDAAGLCEMTLRNEDVLFGQIADESLAVDTQYGKVTVSPSDIDELTAPPEAALGQVSIKLRGGTTVTGKLISQTIGFQVEPGPKLPVFMGNIVHIKCPPPGKASAPGAGAATRPAPPRPVPSGTTTSTRPPTAINAAEAQAREAEAKARAEAEAKALAEVAAKQAADEEAAKAAAANEADVAKARAADVATRKSVQAADRAAVLKALSAQLKTVQAQQDKRAAEARELAKKENSKDALEKNAKAQAELAKNAKELRKQIAAIQQSMLRSTTSQPK